MGLANFYAAVMARVTATGLTHALSTRESAEHASPPRVLWVPSRDTFGPGRKTSATDTHVASCDAAVVIEVWGADVEAVEDLREQLLSAIYTEGHGAFTISGGQWVAEPGAVSLGEKYFLAVSFKFPQRLRPTPTTVTIAAVAPDTTGSATDDGNLDVGET